MTPHLLRRRTDRACPFRPAGNRSIALLPVLALPALAACAALERLPVLFDDATPRERYEAALERAGLGSAALVVDWRAVGELALREASVVATPHVEEGVFPPGEPVAVAWWVTVRRGQEVGLELVLPGDSPTMVFLDAWEAEPDAAGVHRRLAVADSGERLLHGIDIFAPRGTPVVAATAGTMARVGVQGLGGNVVWLRDDDGHSLYYAHLDRWAVEQGARVAAGDTIGFVGNTGNARTTTPHLHFGVYRRGEGPLDPWWFAHRPRRAPARLAADTALLGRRVLAAEDGLPPEPLRVVGATGSQYRLRLPDGLLVYVGAAAVALVGDSERSEGRKVGK
jgi:murein DD-endopeptidase MepM/ murein hydrolase activator NlpD